MDTHVEIHQKNVGHSIFHHGMVMLLSKEEFKKQKQSWYHFLFQSGFEVNPRGSFVDKQNEKLFQEYKIHSY